MSEGEFKKRMKLLEDKFGLEKEFPLVYFLAELETWLSDAKKEFPYCCEPNHYISKNPTKCPVNEWFAKYFGSQEQEANK